MEPVISVITKLYIIVNLNDVQYEGSEKINKKLSKPANCEPNPNASCIVKASLNVCIIGQYKKINKINS
jgi:hypothetical protein